MASLAQAIEFLFPNKGAHWQVRDNSNGLGEVIQSWNQAGIGAPQPTPAVLNQAKLDAQAALDQAAASDLTERTQLIAALNKLATQDLTAAELRAVLRGLLRRTKL